MLVANHQIDSVQIANGQLCRDPGDGQRDGGKARATQDLSRPLDDGPWSQAIYFHLLECGIRLPPAAGSGSGFTPIPSATTGCTSTWTASSATRNGGKTSTPARYHRNGPLLRPSVEGELPGHVFQADPARSSTLEIGLTLSTRDPISYLDLIKDGQIVPRVRFDEFVQIRPTPEMHFDHSGWFPIRAVTDAPSTPTASA